MGEIRKQLAKVISLFLLCRSRGSNPAHQIWQQAHLTLQTKPDPPGRRKERTSASCSLIAIRTHTREPPTLHTQLIG